MKNLVYPFIVRPLSKEDGGGYLIEFPDLPGCVSDGETVDEAIENGKDAVECWIADAKKHGDEIPLPGGRENFSGKFMQRVPKSLHRQLSEYAKRENTSLNSYVLHLISLGLGKEQGKTKKSPPKSRGLNAIFLEKLTSYKEHKKTTKNKKIKKKDNKK